MKLTTAQAIVRFLIAQRHIIPETNSDVPLFPGVFAIFGHGNVTCLGMALEEEREKLPTWRGQNEQGMALAAVGFTKATRRRQIMVATTSIGPGALNTVTAAGVAHANRLPLLLLAGDTFQSRLPDPVLQQIERFDDPSVTVNDSFKPVVRYWDRITRPEQIINSLPHAVATLLDPAQCGPAFIALPQDVQAESFDYPDRFFEQRRHESWRPRPDRAQLQRAADAISRTHRPLIVAGGGVHYSFAEDALRTFAEAFSIPVVETVAGKASLPASHPLYAGPIGVTGCQAANTLAADADAVIIIGSRLQDFTTSSWTGFDRDALLVNVNVARFDATKHAAVSVVGDARETLAELGPLLDGWFASSEWCQRAAREAAGYHSYIDSIAAPTTERFPSYAQVVGLVDRLAQEGDYVVTAAGGLPGELNNGWRARTVNNFDCEYGFSCMGYEIAGAWGAKIAMPEREVISLVGDGSYMMMNSDLYSSVLTGHKLIVIVCDNGGFAVIHRLQVDKGGIPYNNLLADTTHTGPVEIDFVAHARAMGCDGESVTTINELEAALERARASTRTFVISIRTAPNRWTEGGGFWEVGIPETSDRQEVLDARARLLEGKRSQRLV